MGLRRSHNEDAFVAAPDLGYAVVADGMGGAAAGEVASQIFIDTATEVLRRRSSSPQETAELVREAFRLANARIRERARTDPACRGMGCTAEVAAFFGQQYVIGHLGDSRTYLFRDGLLRQVTRDHSLVQDRIDLGLITRAEARNHPQKNIITRAVGLEDELPAEISRGDLRTGDCFLLCSDGLTDMVEDDVIREILSRPADIRKKVAELIRQAREAGGHDNITAVLCEASARS